MHPVAQSVAGCAPSFRRLSEGLLCAHGGVIVGGECCHPSSINTTNATAFRYREHNGWEIAVWSLRVCLGPPLMTVLVFCALIRPSLLVTVCSSWHSTSFRVAQNIRVVLYIITKIIKWNNNKWKECYLLRIDAFKVVQNWVIIQTSFF